MNDNQQDLFSNGRPWMILEFFQDVMPPVSGDHNLWRERAIALLEAVVPPLVWLRDQNELSLDINTLQAHLALPALIRISRDEHIPEKFRRRALDYLRYLPGYNDEFFDINGQSVGMEDANIAEQQHGYLLMQLTRAIMQAAAPLRDNDDDIFA